MSKNESVWDSFREWESKNHGYFLVIIGLVLLWAMTPILITVFYGAELGDDSAKIGDTFNWFSSLATGLATVMLVYSISLQRKDLAKQSEQLELQREEMVLTREEMENQRVEMANSARAMNEQVEIAAMTALLNTIPALQETHKTNVTRTCSLNPKNEDFISDEGRLRVFLKIDEARFRSHEDLRKKYEVHRLNSRTQVDAKTKKRALEELKKEPLEIEIADQVLDKAHEAMVMIVKLDKQRADIYDHLTERSGIEVDLSDIPPEADPIRDPDY